MGWRGLWREEVRRFLVGFGSVIVVVVVVVVGRDEFTRVCRSTRDNLGLVAAFLSG